MTPSSTLAQKSKNLTTRMKSHETKAIIPVTASTVRARGSSSLDGPTLLLADKNMPQLDGISLAQRAYEVDPDLAIIILTGDATLDSAADAVRLGILDYLEKPVDVDQLGEEGVQYFTAE